MLRFRRRAEAADKPVANERMRPFKTGGERWCGPGVHFPIVDYIGRIRRRPVTAAGWRLAFPMSPTLTTGITLVISAGIAGVLLKSSDGDDGHVRIGWMLREVNLEPAFCLSKFQ